ncbi:MAG: hypothetical protein Q9201_000766 [Fulgogasparrea decipioides]
MNNVEEKMVVNTVIADIILVVPGISLATLQEEVTSFRPVEPFLERLQISTTRARKSLDTREEYESFV